MRKSGEDYKRRSKKNWHSKMGMKGNELLSTYKLLHDKWIKKYKSHLLLSWGTQCCQQYIIMSFGFVYFIIFLNFFSVNLGVCDEELCFVTLIYRHGDRAPVGFYPSDPYGDVSFWPNGWGQLTKLGKLQPYELGKWIRNRYWDFLPSRYSAEDVYVQSTDVDRTLMSAYCVLSGLYECWTDDEIEGLTWKPIPVHTTPIHMDPVLAMKKKCPTYERLLKDLLKSEEVCLVNDYYRDIFGNLSLHSGLNIRTVTECDTLYSILNIQTMHGFILPEWTKDYFPEPLKRISEFSFKLPAYTTPLRRLKCGLLVKDIIKHMEDKKLGKITQKMWMYSAHDTTLTNLMQCLDVFDGVIPAYSSMIIIELTKMDDEYYVTVSYKTSTTLRVLRMPCCEKLCTFQAFKDAVRPVIPNNWEEECTKGIVLG